MARGEARAAAVQMIYAEMLGGDVGAEALAGLLGFSPSGDDSAYLGDVTAGVRRREAALDAALSRHLVNWTLDRLARVDLAILRVAAYEILYRDDVPDGVAVNEAVELSHRFSTDEAGGFINGVLGNLARAGERPT